MRVSRKMDDCIIISKMADKFFNSEMKINKCNILLILDNAPCHKVYPMSNIRIVLLSPDCTGVLWSLNAGMIQLFKAHYRRCHVCHIIKKKTMKMIFLQSFHVMLFTWYFFEGRGMKHGMKFLQKLLLSAGNILNWLNLKNLFKNRTLQHFKSYKMKYTN